MSNSAQEHERINKRQDYLFFAVVICFFLTTGSLVLTSKNQQILLSNQATLHTNHKNILEVCGREERGYEN